MAGESFMRRTLRADNGDRWAYEVLGEGPPCLWLHGFTGSRRSWDAIVSTMQMSHRCVVVDLLGHGESDAPKDPRHYRMDAVVATLHQLMNSLGHPTFDCVGYSMGGRIALALASMRTGSVRRLVLESASPGLETLQERTDRTIRDEQLAEAIAANGIADFVHAWERLPLFASQQIHCDRAALERQRSIRLAQRADGLAGSLRGLGTGAQPSFWSEMAQLTLPILLVTGELDGKFCDLAARMQLLLPNAQHRIVHAAGHAVHMEQVCVYQTLIQDWLTVEQPMGGGGA